MEKLNLTTILFIGLSLLFIICISASYNIYLDKYSKKTSYILENKDYELKNIQDVYNYSKKNVSKKDYEKFTKNLDKQSKKELEFIMDRSLLILNAKDLGHKFITPFTNRQAKDIKHFYKFLNSKKEISKDMIQYGAYNFPNDEIFEHVLYNKLGLKNIRNKKKLKNKAIIDARAYIGESSVILSEFTDDKVYAFEPVDKNFELLLKTIKFNDLNEKIIPIKMYLSEKKGEKILYADKKLNDKTKTNNKKYFVNSTSIDKFVKENNLKIGIIKCDINGNEMNLLKGAEKTIIEQKPILLISIYHSGKDFFEIKKWLEDLNVKYKFKIIRTKPDDILYKTVLVAD